MVNFYSNQNAAKLHLNFDWFATSNKAGLLTFDDRPFASLHGAGRMI
jgi:hypothetical protein